MTTNKLAVLYGIEDCENCNRIKNLLITNNISYNFIDCKNDFVRHHIINVCGAYDLPLIYLSDSNILVYLSLNYKKNSEIVKLSNGMNGLSVLSLNEMENIISLYKLNKL